MEDYHNSFVAWPANRVVFDSETPNSKAGSSRAGSSIARSSKAGSSTCKNQKSPLSATATAKPATTVIDHQSTNEDSPSTPPAPIKKPVAPMKHKSPLIPPSPLRRSERNKFKPNQKIKLLDLSGNNVVVAEGRWSSSNPEHLVHFQPLGPGACRVFVDVVKIVGTEIRTVDFD
ncbi:Uncharacterized protein Rs2_29044 [Raphanus sativus]|nr:Uncharacterized protein Rs2_29044 [Raphanus sativus]